MNDLISRQAAIDAALTYLVEYCGAAFDEDMQRMLKERLDSLPSAQPVAKDINVPVKQPGWIPTSVRLPEDNEEVLFCDNEGERWLGWHYGFWKTERLDFDEDDVVAWMPLPIPYREEEPNE